MLGVSTFGSQLVQFALIWYLTIATGSAMVLATASLVVSVYHSVFDGVHDALLLFNARQAMHAYIQYLDLQNG